MSIEAMKQAYQILITEPHSPTACDKLEVILRQAIAEAEKQEPVMWVMPDGKTVDKWGLQFYGGQTGTPLYTHSQPKQKPLTLEQLREHWQVARVLDMTDAEIDFADYVLIARDIEALYGIKGEA